MADTQRICVLGAGVTGRAVALDAARTGHAVVLFSGEDTKANRAAGEELRAAGVDVRYTDEVQGGFDICVPSPGIPATSALYAAGRAHAACCIGEPEYAWRISPARWIAVTGTNGKTTTVALVAHVLSACGVEALACGNTQDMTTLEAVRARGAGADAEAGAGADAGAGAGAGAGATIVAELSSFQLASTCAFAPDIAVLLNVASDHLSWHGSHEAYRRDKLKLLANLHEGQSAVVNASLRGAADVAGLRARGVRVVVVGEKDEAGCAYLDADGFLRVRVPDHAEEALCHAGKLRIRGAHNVENALAGASAAIEAGCAPAAVAAALRSFAPLAHRIEPCGEVAGVSFFDDSKATNVDATLKALSAFAPGTVVLLAGGRDKNSPLDALVAAAQGACACVVCYGEAASRFASAFEAAGVGVVRAPRMREAFARAVSAARPGDAVVLSPACASFDEFRGFAERGDVFKQLVAAHRAAMPAEGA